MSVNNWWQRKEKVFPRKFCRCGTSILFLYLQLYQFVFHDQISENQRLFVHKVQLDFGLMVWWCDGFPIVIRSLSWITNHGERMHKSCFIGKWVFQTCCTWGYLVSKAMKEVFWHLEHCHTRSHSRQDLHHSIPISNEFENVFIHLFCLLTKFNQTFVVRIWFFSS